MKNFVMILYINSDKYKLVMVYFLVNSNINKKIYIFTSIEIIKINKLN